MTIPRLHTCRLAAVVLAWLGMLLLGGQLAAQLGPNGQGFVSVMDSGAKGDGMADDTTAINAALSRFTQNLRGTSTSGTLFFPPGVYKISAPLILAGTTINSVHLLGAPGAMLTWVGSPDWPMLIVYGSFNPVIEGLRFRTNGRARYGIHLAADNGIKTALGTGVAPGTRTVTPASMSSIGVGTLVKVGEGSEAELVYVAAATPTTFTANFTKAHAAGTPLGGGPSTQRVRIINCEIEGGGLAIGNLLGSVGGTPASSQVSEISIYDTDFRGGAGSASGIVTLDGNNVGNVWIYRSRFFAWAAAVDFSHMSFSSTVDGCNFEGSTDTDIRVNVGGALSVKGVYSETFGQFITATGNARVPGSLTVIGSVAGGASRATYLIAYPGSLTLLGNSFRTLNAAAKVQIGAPLRNPAWQAFSQVFSTGNFFQGASDYAPLFDGSNNQVLPNYYNHQPVNVVSFGDYGGIYGKLVTLNNYFPASALTSQAAAFVPATGMVRAGDNDTAVAFRDHANRTDIPGLAKDASDVVFVGGPAGIGLNSPVQAGNGPALSVQAPGKGTGAGPKAPGTIVGWVPVKVGDATYYLPLVK